MRIIDLLQESRFGGGRGSDIGRSVFSSKSGTTRQKVKSSKLKLNLK